jgi:hypothetical protein
MVTSRFSFPVPAVHLLPPAFVPVPVGLFGWLSAPQLAVAQQVYQLAMERTQAALAPSRVEKHYHRSAN